MPHQQNTQPSAKRHFVPLNHVKIEIIRVTGQNTEFYVGRCALAQKIHQNAANQSHFQSFKPFHLGLSGTINGTVARSNLFAESWDFNAVVELGSLTIAVGRKSSDQRENVTRKGVFE